MPPYVIAKPDEAAYQDYETKMTEAIKQHQFTEYDRLSAEQMKLGRFRPRVQHSFEGGKAGGLSPADAGRLQYASVNSATSSLRNLTV